MRIIADRSIIILFIIYWAVTIIAWWGLSYHVKISKPGHLRILKAIWFLTGILQSCLLCFLYVYHSDQAGKYFYPVYTWYNAIFVTDLVCKVPLLISALLMVFSRKIKFRTVASWMGIILGAGIFFTLLYGIFIGSRTFDKQEVTLHFRNLPSAFDGFRIVQLSDVHLGSLSDKNMIKKMAEISGKFNPDVIFFTGDLVNNFARETRNWSSEFLLFRASCGKYAILGNHDYGDYSKWQYPSLKQENFSEIENAYKDFGFRLLRNESEKIVKGKDSIFITGLENWGHPPFHRYANLEMASKNLPAGSFCILLSHDPAYWESHVRPYKKYPLTLSGHTHGFQWGIMFAGIPFSLIWTLEHNWGGLYRYEERYLYVNRGVGMIGMHLRIDMPAEITLITLRRS